MNKNEFLRQLERELNILDRNERKELMDFYEERFYNGIYYEGKTEYQVVEELEPPRVIARNILEQYGIKANKIAKPEERFKGVSGGSIAWLLAVDVFFLSWVIPALFSVTLGIFASVLTYIPVFTFIIGEKSQYDIMIFWFLTGFYILLFNFALVILDLFLWTIKKAIRFHLNTFKVRKRADYNKMMNKVNVDGFIKKRKKLLSFKRLTFISALLLVGFFGARLAMNADNIYGLYVNQEVITEVDQLDVSSDILAEEVWDFDITADNMNVVIVKSDTDEIIITREYQDEEYDFTVSIDDATNTVTVIQSSEPDYWDWNVDINLEEIMKLIKPDVLTIEVPMDLNIDTVDMNTINSSIEVDGVDMDHLVVSNANGKMTFRYFDTNSVNVESINSTVYVEEVNITNQLTIDVVNGSITVYDSKFLVGDLDTSNGKVKLQDINVDAKNGVTLDINTTNGKVTLINVYVASVNAQTTNGDIHYNNVDTGFNVDFDRETTNGSFSGNVD